MGAKAHGGKRKRRLCGPRVRSLRERSILASSALLRIDLESLKTFSKGISKRNLTIARPGNDEERSDTRLVHGMHQHKLANEHPRPPTHLHPSVLLPPSQRASHVQSIFNTRIRINSIAATHARSIRSLVQRCFGSRLTPETGGEGERNPGVTTCIFTPRRLCVRVYSTVSLGMGDGWLDLVCGALSGETVVCMFFLFLPRSC